MKTGVIFLSAILACLLAFAGCPKTDEAFPAPETDIEKLNDASFEKAETGLALVYFFTGYCQECSRQHKTLDEVLDKNEDVQIYSVNIYDENSKKITDKFGLSKCAVMLMLKDGEEVERQEGYMTADLVSKWFEKHSGSGEEEPAEEEPGQG